MGELQIDHVSGKNDGSDNCLLTFHRVTLFISIGRRVATVPGSRTEKMRKLNPFQPQHYMLFSVEMIIK